MTWWAGKIVPDRHPDGGFARMVCQTAHEKWATGRWHGACTWVVGNERADSSPGP